MTKKSRDRRVAERAAKKIGLIFRVCSKKYYGSPNYHWLNSINDDFLKALRWDNIPLYDEPFVKIPYFDEYRLVDTPPIYRKYPMTYDDVYGHFEPYSDDKNQDIDYLKYPMSWFKRK